MTTVLDDAWMDSIREEAERLEKAALTRADEGFSKIWAELDEGVSRVEGMANQAFFQFGLNWSNWEDKWGLHWANTRLRDHDTFSDAGTWQNN